MTLNDLKNLAIMTLRQPEAALRGLQSLDLPMQVRWMVLVLAVVCSTLLARLSLGLFPIPVENPLAALAGQPLKMAALQLAGLAIIAWLMAVAGRLFGGRGSFADAVLIVAWVELLMAAAQALQTVLMVFFPAVASLFGMVALLVSIYLFVAFARALHGFASLALTAVGAFATFFVAALALSILLSILGFTPPMPEAP